MSNKINAARKQRLRYITDATLRRGARAPVFAISWRSTKT